MIWKLKSKRARVFFYCLSAVCLMQAALIAGVLAGIVPVELLAITTSILAAGIGLVLVIYIPLVIWRVSYWRGRSDEYDERNKRG